MASIYGNVTRLTGLASGMDTDSIVKNMMQIEQIKLNRELRQRTLVQWRQEQLSSIANDFKEFRNTFMSQLSAKNMLNKNNYVRFTAKTTDTSGAIGVTTNASNTASKVTIDGIVQLASAATAKSRVDSGSGRGNVIQGNFGESNDVRLGDIAFTNDIGFDRQGNVSFEINGQTFTFNENDTLQTVLSKVSNDEKAGVVLNYSRLTNAFTLSTKETGIDATLSFKNVSGNVFGMNGAFQIESFGGMNFIGKNALLSVNGVMVVQSSNSFTIDGVNYQLNKENAKIIDGKLVSEGAIEYTFEKDVQGAVDKIKEFVEGYNTMIHKLELMVSERKTTKEKSYTPLTDEEKSGMTEDQVKEWDAIAKKGLFTNDAGINSVLSQLRNALYETVSGAGLSPSQIGLKTGSYFDGKLGEIVLDENQLKAALEKDADQVMRVFMNLSGSDDAATIMKENGLMYRVQDILNTYTKTTQAVTLDGMDRSIRRYDDKITQMEKRMAELEEKYYLKFAAMEQAMSELQNQTNSLVNMLNSGSK